MLHNVHQVTANFACLLSWAGNIYFSEQPRWPKMTAKQWTETCYQSSVELKGVYIELYPLVSYRNLDAIAYSYILNKRLHKALLQWTGMQTVHQASVIKLTNALVNASVQIYLGCSNGALHTCVKALFLSPSSPSVSLFVLPISPHQPTAYLQLILLLLILMVTLRPLSVNLCSLLRILSVFL